MTKKVTLPAVIEAYIKTRDEISAMKKAFDESVAKLKETQEKREKWLLAQLEKAGVESVKSDAGTVFQKTSSYVRVQDWDAFSSWAYETGNTHMLKKDTSKTAVVQHYEMSKELPPGLGLERQLNVSINRPKSAKKGDNDE